MDNNLIVDQEVNQEISIVEAIDVSSTSKNSFITYKIAVVLAAVLTTIVVVLSYV